MRSLKEDRYFRDREHAARQLHENEPARAWIAAIRGLHVALLKAELERLTAAAPEARKVLVAQIVKAKETA